MATILVVDDEPLIRDMLTLVLKREGFSVVCAANGVQALYKYRLYKDDIELVICDVVMPELGGPALAERLLVEQPDLPIILMSDECDNIDSASRRNMRFLAKPFNLATLRSTVQSLVGERSTMFTSGTW